MMEKNYFKILFLLLLLQVLNLCCSLPLCTDSSAPFTTNSSLQFCSYNRTSSCCDSTQDLSLRRQFQLMNISNPACASLVKAILCARCDQFSAELFRIDTFPRQLPVLCNSTVSPNSTQSNQATNNFCSQVWTTCQNVSILNSPFTALRQNQAGSNSTTLAGLFQSQSDFCNALGGSSDDGSVCFDGSPVALNETGSPTSPPSGMCLEKIGNGSYLNMVPHPDGSNRAFFSNQAGQIWLATIPEEGSAGVLGIDEANPFLDLTDEVHFDVEFGMLGLAFHPRFTENGRFFVSYNCDKAKWPNCAGICSCNSDVNCDPSTLGADNGAQPCQYSSVIAEYTVNGTTTRPSSATGANPSEVRRIFTMGLPFTSHHGGQILFGPRDGYLYFMMGDGGGAGDPYNFAQNKKSLLGKIMRFDIDDLPNASGVSQLGLWGNYSIPRDNPFVADNNSQKEIWALGLRNPWRCSFDSAKPSYLFCADVGQDLYEEVDLITKGGNYGYRVFEGPYPFIPTQSPGGNTSVRSIRPIFPIAGYNHSEVNGGQGSASITGGYVYRSQTDPCMYGRYLFADLYAGSIWTANENPINSGNFRSSQIPFACARDSPLNCTFRAGTSVPSLNLVFSFGEDNNGDVYLLTRSGVYRIVRPSRCNYACATERPTTGASQGPSSSPNSKASSLRGPCEILLLILISFLWFPTNFA